MMNFSTLARSAIAQQPVYEPGKPIDEVARELGLVPSAIVKLASNENPYGPSPLALAAAAEALSQSQLYPDGGCFHLRAALARHWGLAPGQFVIGNGSNEIIELLGHVFLEPGDEVVMGEPAFVVYKLVTLLFGARAVEVPLRNFGHDLAAMERAITSRTKLVFVATPNNPTGVANDGAELLDFLRRLPPHVICVVDEAYAEFLATPPDLRPLMAEGRAVIGLRTFSKIYGLAGLRVGYGYGHAGLIALVERARQPFNVNAVAQAAATAALDDLVFTDKCRAENALGLTQLQNAFSQLGLPFIPSAANFVLVKVGDGGSVFGTLQKRGIIVRPMKSYGMAEWVRVTVGSREQNTRLLEELARILN